MLCNTVIESKINHNFQIVKTFSIKEAGSNSKFLICPCLYAQRYKRRWILTINPINVLILNYGTTLLI